MEENVWSASASCCNRSPIFPRKIGDVHIWLSLDFFHILTHSSWHHNDVFWFSQLITESRSTIWLTGFRDILYFEQLFICKKKASVQLNRCFLLVAEAGFEPTTFGL